MTCCCVQFNALDKEHGKARDRIENLTRQLDSRQNEMNELLSVKYRHEGQIEAYRKQLQKTHTETANIQVEVATLRSECSALKGQVSAEQTKKARSDRELEVRTKEVEQLSSNYDNLIQVSWE